MGAPKELILLLKKQFALRTFVETGTFQGGTSVWAASHFEQVITVENSRAIFEKTVAKHGGVPNIKFLFGHSTATLREIVPTLDSPALFWLDSHWCLGESYGEQDECPLLEEITIINSSPLEHFLLIDDARLFIAPPPTPLQIDAWPPIDQVTATIQAGASQKYIAIYEDVIIAVPQKARQLVAKWLQNINTEEWRQFRKLKASRLRRGMGLVGEGLSLLGQSALARVRPTAGATDDANR
jgi:hypothetical protein